MVSSHLETTLSDEQQGQAPEAADTTTTDTQPQQQDTTTPQETQAVPQRVEDLPDWAQKLIKDTRKDAGDQRHKAKEYETAAQQAQREREEFLDRIAKAAGWKSDDAPPDPDELTKQLTEAAKERDDALSKARTALVESAAKDAAYEHGADVKTLLDSRSFSQKLSNLDPSAEGFADAVSDLVKQTVEDNPKYRVAQAAASSSADFSSGPGEQRTRKPIGLHAAFRNHYSG